MERINYSVEVPRYFNEIETESKIVKDLEEISVTFLDMIPINCRNEISVSSGRGSAAPYKSIGQLSVLYRSNRSLSISYNGPIVETMEGIKDLDEVEIYQTLLSGGNGDTYNISLKDGRKISGVPIFNQKNGTFKILDMFSEISIDLFVEEIRGVRLDTNISRIKAS
jgi:hypothetical protein